MAQQYDALASGATLVGRDAGEQIAPVAIAMALGLACVLSGLTLVSVASVRVSLTVRT